MAGSSTGQGSTGAHDTTDYEPSTASSEPNDNEYDNTSHNRTAPDSNIDSHEDEAVINICQILQQEECGIFDFDVDDGSFGFIQDVDDFRTKLNDYERANDKVTALDPIDPEVLQNHAREIAKTLTNEKIRSNAAASRLLDMLKKTEVNLLAWTVLVAVLDVQQGKCRGKWGNNFSGKNGPEKFDTWENRLLKVKQHLGSTRNPVKALIEGRERFAWEAAAFPREKLRQLQTAREWRDSASTRKRASTGMAASEEESNQPGSSKGKQSITPGSGFPAQPNPSVKKASMPGHADDSVTQTPNVARGDSSPAAARARKRQKLGPVWEGAHPGSSGMNQEEPGEEPEEESEE